MCPSSSAAAPLALSRAARWVAGPPASSLAAVAGVGRRGPAAAYLPMLTGLHDLQEHAAPRTDEAASMPGTSGAGHDGEYVRTEIRAARRGKLAILARRVFHAIEKLVLEKQ